MRRVAVLERRAGYLGVVLACLVACSAALGQSVIKQGVEFQVNSYTFNNEYQPAISSDADGDFVVTWTDAAKEVDGIQGIFGKRFSSAGAVLVDEFHVNTYTESIQHRSSVSAEDNGDFVVVWQSFGQASAGDYGVFGQRFDSSGAAVGTEFQVNSSTGYYLFSPRVSSDADGDFVVVWGSSGQDASASGVFARRFASSGAALGGEFQVNTHTSQNQEYPVVAVSASGDFVVAWESFNQIVGSGYDVFAKRFNSAGAVLGSEFLVNTYTSHNQYRPTVAAEADGDFVVAWQSAGQDGPVPPYGILGVFARRFTSAGAPQAAEFQVNVFTQNYQRFPDITADNGGNFVVTWESAHQDGSYESVFARRVTAAGAAFGPEFQVNSYTNDGQSQPVAAFAGSGGFVVAWTNEAPQDGNASGVFAQRFSLPPLAVLDIDGNGALGALTDGLLYLRYRFSLTGTALTAGAVGVGCTRCDGATIVAYLNGLGTTLDVDGNGGFSALTDGLLVVRFLFNLSGTALTNGVVGAGCTRCDAAAIVPYLQMFD
jgi:hypothetical protein